jgi:hypothetical protein
VAGVQLASWALTVTDAMCQVVLSSNSTSVAGQFSDVMLAGPLAKAPQMVQMVLYMLLIAGTILVWLELLVRAAAVYVAVFFMPLALACYIWPATVAITRRSVEVLIALILSKFVIVAALFLGLSALDQQSSTDVAVAGSAVLLIAGFAPFTLLRLAPIVEAQVISHLEGLSRRPFRAAEHLTATATSNPVARLILSRAGGSAVSHDPVPVAAQPLPQRQPDYLVDGPEV